MKFDGHIHLVSEGEQVEGFKNKLKKANIQGGIVFSPPPPSFGSNYLCSEKRIEKALKWTDFNSNLYAFYWIDPLESNAEEQVELAFEKGIDGFKVICNNFYPGDEKPMKIWEKISQKGLPILFHSGISYLGINSSKYHRPAEFEALFAIKKLKFCLAHISWPWCDECLAVYGKYSNSIKHRYNSSVQMFIDITRGTPSIYRKDIFKKIFNIGYDDIENSIMFGTDNSANNYNYKRTKELINKDNEIYNELNIKSKIIDKIYKDNLIRFVKNDSKS